MLFCSIINKKVMCKTVNQQPLVSIITPCYNGEEYLHYYFDSILAQTYDRMELIFVNDGSTDQTEEVALSYRDALESCGIIFKYINKPNGGQASAMNVGFQHMTGKYLVWPDSDDVLSPDSIAKRVAFLEENPEYDFVRSNGEFIDFFTREVRCPLTLEEDVSKSDIFLDLILERTYCACGCYMIKTEMLREIYPDLRIYESSAGQNWQILIPIAGRGKCGYIDEKQYQIASRWNSHSRSKRALIEKTQRQNELKKVLEIGVQLSARKERDYLQIVQQQHYKKLFYIFYNEEKHTKAKECYALFSGSVVQTKKDKLVFLKAYHPIRYYLCRIQHCILNRFQNQQNG